MSGSTQVATPNDNEITVTRRFNAPRERVFDAFTRSELVRRWTHGPNGWTLTTCTLDARPGGMEASFGNLDAALESPGAVR